MLLVFRGVLILSKLFFFFSSRRRHTRFDCDWSSDVCSSDLLQCGDHGKHAMWGDVWPRRPGTGSASRLQLHAQAREQDLPAIALQALYHHAAIAVQVDAQGAAVAGVVVQVTGVLVQILPAVEFDQPVDRKSTRLN